MLFTQECVGEDNELSHNGCDGDFRSFSGFFELVVLGLEIGIEADGDERRHVEGLPDDGPSASDEGTSGPSSGLPVDWRKARELAGGLFIQFAQFGHLDEKGKGRNLRQAGNGDKDVEARPEAFVTCDTGGDGLLDLGELSFDLLQPGKVLPFEEGLVDVLAAVLRRRPVLHQRQACSMQLLEFTERRSVRVQKTRAQQQTKSRQHLRVDPVCLGQRSDGIGKSSRLARIDLGA